MRAQKAITFVKDKGSELEKARLRHILYARDPDAGVVRPFLDLQSRRGAFPLRFQKGNPDMIDNTLTALWWLDELGMLKKPAGKNALEFLQAAQMDDGGWDEDLSTEEYQLPPWVRPGDLNTRMYLTAYAAYWLAASGFRQVPVLERAFDFLLPYQKESGLFHGFRQTTWIATGACLLAGLTQPANRSLQALLELPLSEWEDSQCAWALDCLHRGGVERDHPLVEGLLAKLEASQNTQGQWASEDGESYAVSATIGVLKAFKLYNLLPEIPPKNLTDF